MEQQNYNHLAEADDDVMAVSSTQQPIVTSGEDDDDDDDSVLASSSPSNDEAAPFYDASADERDATHVHSLSSSNETKTTTTTDAILSCPCCFNIVCTDCQQHDFYPHIFRAMFVRSITVSWDRQLVYDEASQSLVVRCESTAPSAAVTRIPPPEEEEEVYYTVRCAKCETVVAALDMRDEVYHFSGCLASSMTT